MRAVKEQSEGIQSNKIRRVIQSEPSAYCIFFLIFSQPGAEFVSTSLVFFELPIADVKPSGECDFFLPLILGGALNVFRCRVKP